MTRKHFNAIADAIRDSIEDTDIRLTAACAVARAIRGTAKNSRFDIERFVNACMK